jgi:hypothetical protein
MEADRHVLKKGFIGVKSRAFRVHLSWIYSQKIASASSDYLESFRAQDTDKEEYA